MKSLLNTVIIGICLLLSNEALAEQKPKASFTYIESGHKFTAAQKHNIESLTVNTMKRMKAIEPTLAENIHFTFKTIDRDLSMVYGVSGRADTKNEIEVILSTQYLGGISAAINQGLEGTLFHEMHHTVRGWTIKDNKFPKGIDVAAANEGLADIFAEIMIGRPMNTLPDEDYDSWVKEIRALPQNASYGQWMFMHPDGRMAVGYRSGAYLIKEALKHSNMGILDLSKLSSDELYKLARY